MQHEIDFIELGDRAANAIYYSQPVQVRMWWAGYDWRSKKNPIHIYAGAWR